MIALRSFPPGPDKEAFHRYLGDFGAVEDEGGLLDSLYDCTDVMPDQYARLLFLAPGAATYRDAVRLHMSSWNSVLRGPDDPSVS